MKFGIGQPMRRHEDLRLITGRGCYTDDVMAPTQILFGTDFPFLTAKATAAGLREVGLFNTTELQAIERGNAAQLMPKYKT